MEGEMFTLGEFQKNRYSVVKITQKEYMGHDLIDIRVWAKLENGTLVPTKKGISIRLEQLAELETILKRIKNAN